jgi:hypothetical protein
MTLKRLLPALKLNRGMNIMTPVLYGKGMLSWGKNDKVEKSILSFFIVLIKDIKILLH